MISKTTPVINESTAVIRENAKKFLEGKILKPKQAFEYFEKNRMAGFSPVVKFPNGTTVRYMGDTYEVTKLIERPNGEKIQARFFKNRKNPIEVIETGKNGIEIKHSNIGDMAYSNSGITSVVKTPEGASIYKSGVGDTAEFSLYTNDHISGFKTPQLKGVFETLVNSVRKG